MNVLDKVKAAIDKVFSEEEKTTNIVDFAVGENKLFNEIQEYADPPDWIPYLPKPGNYVHPAYGKISITPDRNSHFVKNHAEGVYQKNIPVDLEHQYKLSGAAGHIQELRQNTDGSVDARVAWTDMGSEMIKKDRFKYFSPEWRDVWTDPMGKKHTDVATGGALTNKPFFKEDYLRPLVANEKGLFFTEDAVNGTATEVTFLPMQVFTGDKETEQEETQTKIVFAFNPKRKIPDDTDETDDPEDTGDPDEKDEPDNQMDPKKKVPPFMKGKKMTEEKTTVVTMSEDVQRQFTEMQEQIKQLSERNAALEQASRTKRFTEIVAGPTPWIGAEHKVHIATLESLATSVDGGEESETFKTYVASMNAAAAQVRDAKLFAEIGSGAAVYKYTSSFESKIKTAAEAIRAANPSLTLEQAMTRAIEQNPQMYSEYEAERAIAIKNA